MQRAQVEVVGAAVIPFGTMAAIRQLKKRNPLFGSRSPRPRFQPRYTAPYSSSISRTSAAGTRFGDQTRCGRAAMRSRCRSSQDTGQGPRDANGGMPCPRAVRMSASMCP